MGQRPVRAAIGQTEHPVCHPGGHRMSVLQSGRPNILYVIQEDIGPNHGCYGEPLVKTPNEGRLAAQGMRFTNMFCTGPVCSASRSALMSGRYQNNIGAHNHRTWEWHKQTLPAPRSEEHTSELQ